jgi:hypothetical protein
VVDMPAAAHRMAVAAAVDMPAVANTSNPVAVESNNVFCKRRSKPAPPLCICDGHFGRSCAYRTGFSKPRKLKTRRWLIVFQVLTASKTHQA